VTVLSAALSAQASTLKPIPFPKDLCPSTGRELLAEDDSVALTFAGAGSSVLASRVEGQTGKPLTPAPRAQLILITPLEWAMLKQHLGMPAVREMAQKLGLMKMELKAVCLKRMDSQTKGGAHESWFVQVEAPEGLAFRRAIWRTYLSKGGRAEDFEWKRWVPHVLVGTRGPMNHDADYVHRNRLPCVADFAP